VAAEEEREETKQVEQEGDHRVGIFSDQSRQINHLPPDGVLAKDRRSRPTESSEQLMIARRYDAEPRSGADRWLAFRSPRPLTVNVLRRSLRLQREKRRIRT